MAEEISASNAVVDVEGPLPALWANPTALEQVLTNLLSNGLKFVHDGVPARITIRTATTAGYCRVLIQDNGIGIAKEHQRSIFGVFQRLHSADKYPGSGIGLAIVQKSVERMEGKVGVSSTSGKGSCFWFELRLA